MTTTIHSTTSRETELEALRDEIYAEQRAIRGDFTIQDAAKCALAQIGTLADYAAGWDASADALLVAAYAPCLECPEPEPPTPPHTAAQRKAAYNAAQGVKAVRGGGGWLVPSATRNVVHFVSDSGICSCEAGASGKPCWHLSLVGMQDRKVAA